MNNPAYVIGHISVKDEDKWAEYRSRIPATLEPWGAKLVFRGTRLAVLGGNHRHANTVVIQFPDSDAADNWFNSKAYQELVPLRMDAAEVDLISYSADS